MKTEYKHIYFVKVADKPKTSVWYCRSEISNDLLGIVKWYSPWRQYCFYPEPNTIFNPSCHKDIDDFMRQLEEGK